MPRARWCRPSRCWMRWAVARPSWRTPPPSSGWAATRPAAFFLAVPFGLMPLEHVAWIEHGGGQALWDELYEPLRGQALHGRQYRHVDGRLAQARAAQRRRPQGPEVLHARPGRRDVCALGHRAGLDAARRPAAGAAERGHRRHRVRRALERSGRWASTRPHPSTTGRACTSPTAPASAWSTSSCGAACRTTSRRWSRTPAGPRRRLRWPRASG